MTDRDLLLEFVASLDADQFHDLAGAESNNEPPTIAESFVDAYLASRKPPVMLVALPLQPGCGHPDKAIMADLATPATHVKVTEVDGSVTPDGGYGEGPSWYIGSENGLADACDLCPAEAKPTYSDSGLQCGPRGHFKVTVEFTPAK